MTLSLVADSELNDVIRAKLCLRWHLPARNRGGRRCGALNALLARVELPPAWSTVLPSIATRRQEFHFRARPGKLPALNSAIRRSANSKRFAYILPNHRRGIIHAPDRPFSAEQVARCISSRESCTCNSVRGSSPTEIHQKLPQQIPVYVPIVPARVSLEGHSLGRQLGTPDLTLTVLMGLKKGDIADGMAIEAGWDRVREGYGHRGTWTSKSIRWRLTMRSRTLFRTL